jgi:hypothetical protein
VYSTTYCITQVLEPFIQILNVEFVMVGAALCSRDDKPGHNQHDHGYGREFCHE